MKVAVIGGGSTYTPELVAGFIARAGALARGEPRLMAANWERLDVVGRLAGRRARSCIRDPMDLEGRGLSLASAT